MTVVSAQQRAVAVLGPFAPGVLIALAAGGIVYAIGGSLTIAQRLGDNLRTVYVFVFAHAGLGLLSGLAGNELDVILGVVLVTLINNVLILAGVPSTWQKVIIGGFILVAETCFAMRKRG